ncbi:hypothetical protein Sulku_1203 [Sulfuricurvum kujiense DSM 16994]|uniref:Uncharacterized protein n=1 Tax=Sulfuricurvum kujiense (strain ATCC BAA-921 / DSM 16994 / JCM 11577 / YK-1) TaxID=709032 RepID=E4TX25_SULKY|nr:hypothetical protein [Sulfuricurvum kujiense]ADR33866.1 hypothetical protein Sulku_1203 [Sulfuricurvum kujiense DSM 16994]
MIIVSIGLFCILVSAVVFIHQWLESGLINKEDREKYLLISSKKKENQTEEEREFVWNNQYAYVTSKIRSIIFQFGVILVISGLFMNYITK